MISSKESNLIIKEFICNEILKLKFIKKKKKHIY